MTPTPRSVDEARKIFDELIGSEREDREMHVGRIAYRIEKCVQESERQWLHDEKMRFANFSEQLKQEGREEGLEEAAVFMTTYRCTACDHFDHDGSPELIRQLKEKKA